MTPYLWEAIRTPLELGERVLAEDVIYNNRLLPYVLTGPEQTRDRYGEFSPTITTDTRETPGRFGNAWQAYDASTNYVLNPQNYPGVGVWASSSGIPANAWQMSQDFDTTVPDLNGNPIVAVKLQAVHPTAILFSMPFETGAFTTGDVVTFSVLMKGSRVGQAFNLRMYSSATAYVETAIKVVTITGDWQYVTFQTIPLPATIIGQALRFYIYGASTPDIGDTIWLCQPQAEKQSINPRPTAFIYGEEFGWNGAAEHSTATRDYQMVSMPAEDRANAEHGTMIVRWRMGDGTSWGNNYLTTIGDHGVADTDWAALNGNAAGLGGFWRQGTANPIRSSARFAVEQGEHYTSAMRWNGSTFQTALDASTWNTTLRDVPPYGVFSGPIRLGGLSSVLMLNGEIEQVVIFRAELTDEEIQAIIDIPGTWTWEGLQTIHTFEDIADPGDPAQPSTFTIRPRLWRSDLVRTRIELLPLALPQRLNVEFNDDMQHKRSASVDMVDPHVLDPLADFFIPEWIMTSADGTETVIPLGHFVVMPARVSTYPSMQQGSVEGKDVTYLLHRAAVLTRYTVPTGSNPGAAARQVALDFGLPAEMVNIPDSTKVLTKDMVWEPGEDRLTIINDLLGAGLMNNCFTDANGVLQTRKSEDLATAAPDATYSSERGPVIIPPITENQPDISRVRNVVTVRKTTPGEDAIFWTESVTDETSPIHPERLAERMNAPLPIILSETVEDSNIIDEEDAETKAKELLSIGGGFYRSLEMVRTPEPGFDTHFIIELDVRNGEYVYYDGNWRRRVYRAQSIGAQATVRMELNRLERWQ
jgi:hypothetical protein